MIVVRDSRNNERDVRRVWVNFVFHGFNTERKRSRNVFLTVRVLGEGNCEREISVNLLAIFHVFFNNNFSFHVSISYWSLVKI